MSIRIDGMETQELEVFVTPIGTSVSSAIEVNYNGNGNHPVS